MPPGRVGRLWVRGPSVMAGYFDQPEATARALRRGWLDTGDLGFVHEGELYLYSRQKDVIIVAGRNHAPQEVEQALDGLAGLRAGCAVAIGVVPPGGDGEQLTLLLERDREAPPEGDDELARAAGAEVTAATGLRPAKVLVLEPGTLPAPPAESCAGPRPGGSTSPASCRPRPR